ncbi:hypothetical protein [Pseudolysinimonas sp.]|uniref:hypothetical protein n=1 Tax=Pseudolysinimonas sp. TaxID=2680009 RepID=UPI00326405FD
MSWRSRSVPPVWVAALVGAVLVGIFAGAAFLSWLPVVLAIVVLLTFVIQLSLQRKDGLVNRIIASIGGSLALLAVATVVLLLLNPGSLDSLGA